MVVQGAQVVTEALVRATIRHYQTELLDLQARLEVRAQEMAVPEVTAARAVRGVRPETQAQLLHLVQTETKPTVPQRQHLATAALPEKASGMKQTLLSHLSSGSHSQGPDCRGLNLTS